MVTGHAYRRAAKRIDWYLVGTTLLLCVAGCTAVYSAVHDGETALFKKHLIWLGIGLVGAVAFTALPLGLWLRHASKLYVIGLVLLFSVLLLGSRAGGAQRWFELGPIQFQPSELAKLILILYLASFLSKRAGTNEASRGFWPSFFVVAAPAALVFKQPDLGTSLVFIGIWLGMCFVAGVSSRLLLGWLAVAFVLFLVAWDQGVIKDYQKARVVAFLDPSADPRGTGYQVLQARRAIGSGEITGKGFLQGRQKQGAWIPVQETDFIFTVVGEEGGFIGSSMVVSLYGFLLYRLWHTCVRAREPSSKLVAAGVLSMWSYHVLVNLAMVLGLFPVVGVPLPLMSYGGSSTLVSLCSLGLVLGIRAREEKIVF